MLDNSLAGGSAPCDNSFGIFDCKLVSCRTTLRIVVVVVGILDLCNCFLVYLGCCYRCLLSYSYSYYVCSVHVVDIAGAVVVQQNNLQRFPSPPQLLVPAHYPQPVAAAVQTVLHLVGGTVVAAVGSFGDSSYGDDHLPHSYCCDGNSCSLNGSSYYNLCDYGVVGSCCSYVAECLCMSGIVQTRIVAVAQMVDRYIQVLDSFL